MIFKGYFNRIGRLNRWKKKEELSDILKRHDPKIRKMFDKMNPIVPKKSMAFKTWLKFGPLYVSKRHQRRARNTLKELLLTIPFTDDVITYEKVESIGGIYQGQLINYYENGHYQSKKHGYGRHILFTEGRLDTIREG